MRMSRLIVSAALAAALPLAALAQVMPARTIDMTTELHDEGGTPAKDVFNQGKDDPLCLHCPSLTLGHAISHALFATLPEERDLSAEQKWARGALAMRIKDDKAATLTADEVAVIKRLLGKLYGPIVVMQTYPILDPNAKAPEVK